MKILISISIILFFSCNNNDHNNKKINENPDVSEQIDIKKGKELFLDKCSQCHTSLLHTHSSLAGFWKNIPESNDKKKYSWLKSYLSNSDSLFKENDSYTNLLKEKYDTTIESHKIILNNKELLNLLTYIRKSD